MLEEFIKEEMKILPQKADKCGMLDYYGILDFKREKYFQYLALVLSLIHI